MPGLPRDAPDRSVRPIQPATSPTVTPDRRAFEALRELLRLAAEQLLIVHRRLHWAMPMRQLLGELLHEALGGARKRRSTGRLGQRLFDRGTAGSRNAPGRAASKTAEQFLAGGHIDRSRDAPVCSGDGSRHVPSGRARTLGGLAWSRARLRLRGFRFVERRADAIPSEDLLRIDTCWSVATGLVLVDPVRAA